MSKSAKDRFDPIAFLAKVGDGKTILDYRKNQVVFRQGEIADKVFYIQKGRIKVVVISDLGREAVVGIMEPGQFFGEGCLNGHPLRVATTTAMEHCVITSITKEAMLEAPPWRADVCRIVHDVSSVTEQPDRRGPCRPVVQFQ